jgi:translation initiation factor IF-2
LKFNSTDIRSSQAANPFSKTYQPGNNNRFQNASSLFRTDNERANGYVHPKPLTNTPDYNKSPRQTNTTSTRWTPGQQPQNSNTVFRKYPDGNNFRTDNRSSLSNVDLDRTNNNNPFSPKAQQHEHSTFSKNSTRHNNQYPTRNPQNSPRYPFNPQIANQNRIRPSQFSPLTNSGKANLRHNGGKALDATGNPSDLGVDNPTHDSDHDLTVISHADDDTFHLKSGKRSIIDKDKFKRDIRSGNNVLLTISVKKDEKFAKNQPKKLKAKSKDVYLHEGITVSNLSTILNISFDNLSKRMSSMGFASNADFVLNSENASLIVQEFGFVPHIVDLDSTDLVPRSDIDFSVCIPRPPVVTIMGVFI